jgi:hypothetical protein
MKFRIVMSAVALAALAGCGGEATPGNYPEKDRQAVLTSCRGSGAPAQVCECALKKIEAKFTYAEFISWNAALEKSEEHPASAQAEVMTNECIADYLKTNPQ